MSWDSQPWDCRAADHGVDTLPVAAQSHGRDHEPGLAQPPVLHVRVVIEDLAGVLVGGVARLDNGCRGQSRGKGHGRDRPLLNELPARADCLPWAGSSGVCGPPDRSGIPRSGGPEQKRSPAAHQDRGTRRGAIMTGPGAPAIGAPDPLILGREITEDQETASPSRLHRVSLTHLLESRVLVRVQGVPAPILDLV